MLKINGEPVDASYIDDAFTRLKPQYDHYASQHGEKPDDARLRSWARESVIERVLLQQEAATLELAAAPEAAEGTSDELQRKVQTLIASITDQVPAPTDEEIAKAYAENMQHFQVPEQVHAAHIVKHTNNGESDADAYSEMLNIRARLDKGESFESLASEHSDCSDNAGDLGTFPRGQMVQEFEDVVFNMNPDDVSDVFQSPFGYHIVKLYEKVDAGATPLEQVRERLGAHIHDTRRNDAVHAFLDTLKAKATIEDDEA